MRQVRIEVDGKIGRIFDAKTGEEIRGIRSYTVTHEAGCAPLVEIRLIAVVQNFQGVFEASSEVESTVYRKPAEVQ